MQHRARLTVVRIAFAGALVLPGRPAVAQITAESFAQLQPSLPIGHTVIVEDSTGSRIKGSLTALTATSMTVTPKLKQPRTFAADGVTRVTRFDSRLNGFLIGAAAGAVPGLMLGHGWSEYCNNEAGGHCPVAYAVFGGLFSAIGGWIGWSVDGAINHDHFVVAVSRKF